MNTQSTLSGRNSDLAAARTLTTMEKVKAYAGLSNNRNMSWYFLPEDGFNFGDWIGPYLFEEMTGKTPLLWQPRFPSRATVYFTVGSILHTIRRPDVAIVWGSGAISPDRDFPRPRDVLAVRGPLTREVMMRQGYRCPQVYGDPAILMPRFYDPAIDFRYCIGIVPHFSHLEETKRRFSGRKEIKVVDVRQPVKNVIDDILSCEHVLSSSLHGLIISHSYGRPAAWIRFELPLVGDGFKFNDYFFAGGIAGEVYPESLSGKESTSTLKAMCSAAPMPDNEKLAAALIDACPFS